MDNRIVECVERVNYLLSNPMAAKPREEVLIVINLQADMRMASAIAAAVLKCGAEYNISTASIRGKDKVTILPKTLEKAMKACDVFVGMTTASGAAIHNNRLKEPINEKRLREASIRPWNIDNLTRSGALADYEKVYADRLWLREIWRGHKIARVTTPAGTNITMEMNQMEPIIECDIARNPGDTMAWSDGEISLGPVIGTTEGTIAVDGPICYYGYPIIPVELCVEKGRIVEVVGGDPEVYKETHRQTKETKDSDSIAEVGLGPNPACMFNGDFEEEKKARGTLHFAMGNGFYHGQPPCSAAHVDIVLYNPTVYFDDVLTEKNGRPICLGGE